MRKSSEEMFLIITRIDFFVLRHQCSLFIFSLNNNLNLVKMHKYRMYKSFSLRSNSLSKTSCDIFVELDERSDKRKSLEMHQRQHKRRLVN